LPWAPPLLRVVVRRQPKSYRSPIFASVCVRAKLKAKSEIAPLAGVALITTTAKRAISVRICAIDSLQSASSCEGECLFSSPQTRGAGCFLTNQGYRLVQHFVYLRDRRDRVGLFIN